MLCLVPIRKDIFFLVFFFFFNDTATTEIYTLSLHDALPILPGALPYLFSGMKVAAILAVAGAIVGEFLGSDRGLGYLRSEEHTSELQSRLHLVCRLLLEKKKPYVLCQLLFHHLIPTDENKDA